MSVSPVLQCVSPLLLLKSQLCFKGRQLWLAGTYCPPVPQQLTLSGHLGLRSQPVSRSRDVGFIPLCCQPLVSTQPFPITGTAYKGCKGGGYRRFSLVKKSQENQVCLVRGIVFFLNGVGVSFPLVMSHWVRLKWLLREIVWQRC